MKGALVIMYDGDPLPPVVQTAISIACAEAVAEVMLRYGFPADSVLVQG